MGATVRTFVAIPVSTEIRERLAKIAEEGRRTGGDVKWVDPALIHLTLRFLGDVEEERVPAVVDALGVAAGAGVPFQLRVARVGAFPDLRRPRVIWAGAEEAAAPPAQGSVLQGLASAVEAACARLGFGAADHPFSPHMTLGRARSPKWIERLVPVLERHAADEFGAQDVRAIHLVESKLRPQGPVYSSLAELPLASP